MALTKRQLSDARRELPALLTRVVRDHTPVQVERRGGDAAVLVEREQLREVLSKYTFSPERSRERSGSVSYWLPEFNVWSSERTDEKARHRLAQEAIEYAGDYFAEPVFRHAPNLRHQLPFALRIALAGTLEEVLGIIFPQR